jgi:hypothetical protein
MKRKRNIKLLKQVRDAILKYPDQFEMRTWFSNLNEVEMPASRCGTAACIAGWAVTLDNKDFKGKPSLACDWIDDDDRDVGVLGLAQKVLGITKKQAINLFLDENWPRKFRNEYGCLINENYEGKVTTKQFAEVAARRINHFIKTGK